MINRKSKILIIILGLGFIAIILFVFFISLNWYLYERPKQLEREAFARQLYRDSSIRWLEYRVYGKRLHINAIMPSQYHEFASDFINRHSIAGYDNYPETKRIISPDETRKAGALGIEKIEIVRRNLRTGQLAIEELRPSP